MNIFMVLIRALVVMSLMLFIMTIAFFILFYGNGYNASELFSFFIILLYSGIYFVWLSVLGEIFFFKKLNHKILIAINFTYYLVFCGISLLLVGAGSFSTVLPIAISAVLPLIFKKLAAGADL